MDIWNVAFPEGVDIDPNTAWKVFWKTAASMYGDGGFRVENIDARAPEKVSYGIWWSSKRYNFNPIAHTFDSGSQIDGAYYLGEPLSDDGTYPVYDEWYPRIGEDENNTVGVQSQRQYIHDITNWSISKCAKDRSVIGNYDYMVSLFVAEDSYLTAPSLVIDKSRHQILYTVAAYRRIERPDDVFNNLEQGLHNLLGMNPTELHKRNPTGIIWDSGASVVSFIPADLELNSLLLDIDWPKWWLRIYEGDSTAYQFACLLWCDWILKSLRELIPLDSSISNRDFLRFNYSKSTFVPRHTLIGTTSERASALHYYLFQGLPVRPLHYEF